jgi:O-antigen/teichoic acid export membrane protein
MRPSRGPYVRSDGKAPWFLPTSGTLLVLLVLTVPAYILVPDIFPGVMMWLLAAIAVLILAWTSSKEGRAYLQPHQIVANFGVATMLGVFILLLAAGVSGWPIWLATTAIVGLGVIGTYRRSD